MKVSLPKISVTKVANTVTKFASDYAPEILMTTAAIGFVGAIVETTFHATPKAIKTINEAEEEKGEELTKTEVVKETWKYYIPTTVLVIGSSSALIASYFITRKRHNALVAACAVAVETSNQYKNKLIDIYGEDTASDIISEVDSDAMKKNWDENQIEPTRWGKTCIYDSFTGRYFMSDWNVIASAVNEINSEVLKSYDGQASLNEFYNLLGLTNSGVGDLFGWTTNEQMTITKYGDLAPDDITPCIVMDYNIVRI